MINHILDFVTAFYAALCGFAVAVAALMPILPQYAAAGAAGIVALVVGGLGMAFRRLITRK